MPVERRYVHPFRQQLVALPTNYQPWQLEAAAPRPPLAPVDTPFQFVDTDAGLVAMAQELMSVREVALDLEHHSNRCALLSTAACSVCVFPFPFW